MAKALGLYEHPLTSPNDLALTRPGPTSRAKKDAL